MKTAVILIPTRCDAMDLELVGEAVARCAGMALGRPVSPSLPLFDAEDRAEVGEAIEGAVALLSLELARGFRVFGYLQHPLKENSWYRIPGYYWPRHIPLESDVARFRHCYDATGFDVALVGQPIYFARAEIDAWAEVAIRQPVWEAGDEPGNDNDSAFPSQKRERPNARELKVRQVFDHLDAREGGIVETIDQLIPLIARRLASERPPFPAPGRSTIGDYLTRWRRARLSVVRTSSDK